MPVATDNIFGNMLNDKIITNNNNPNKGDIKLWQMEPLIPYLA